MKTQNNKIVDKVDRAFERIAEWSIAHRLFIIVATLALVVAGVVASSGARVNNSYDAFFDKNDPTYVAYMQYLDDFMSDEVAYILYHAPDAAEGPFDIEVMQKVAQLTEALELEVPFVREATSLANVEFISADEDTILVDELLLDFPETQGELLNIRERVMSKPLYVDYLIDQNKKYSAIIVEMELTSSDTLDKMVYDPEKGDSDLNNLYPQVSDHKIREILARPEYQGIEFFLTGDVHMNATYNEVLTNDSSYIMLATLVLIVIVSFMLFRATLVGMAGPIAVVLVSVILTVGFVGAMGWELNALFAMMPTLLCAVGVAQSVHILLEYQRARNTGSSRNQSVKASLKKVGGPCLMAALTTSAGFLVMSVSELKAINELAIYSSVGVMITFALSTTLLVIFLAGKDKSTANKAGKLSVNPVVSWVVERSIAIDLKAPHAVIAIWGAIFVFAFIGISKLTIDFNFLDEFKPHVEWRKHTLKAEEVMGGIINVAYIVDTKEPEGIKNPDVLKAMEKIQRFAEGLPLVKKSFSVTDIIKDMNQTYNGDNPEYNRLPENPELTAQYFLLYEIGGGEELDEFVSQDFSRTVMEFRVEMTYASNINALQEQIDQFIQDNPIPGVEVKKTGMGLMWVTIARYIADTQVVSYSLVFAMVALIMCIAFGSIRVGLLSMIPNLAPVVLTLGTMGWLGIPLDYMKLMLATIAIGIAVDDTIHLVTRFRSRFLECGNYEQALQRSLRDVGPALVITTIILTISFSSYLFSNTTILASFGVLLAATITVALLADLFLMPVLLMRLKPFGEEFSVEQSKPTEVQRDTLQEAIPE